MPRRSIVEFRLKYHNEKKKNGVQISVHTTLQTSRIREKTLHPCYSKQYIFISIDIGINNSASIIPSIFVTNFKTNLRMLDLHSVDTICRHSTSTGGG
mmetsp:Transcript_13264/g.32392  ORF Transcript_13264/g.32392 Transcript_13264/m.32392 type:complete len:98 (-) Transcript_13264:45-338(-)